MRAILGFVLAAGLATSAAAQGPVEAVSPGPAPVQEGGYTFSAHGARPLQEDRHIYEMQLLRLKREMDRLTREDGGQLTAEHQASLQKRLDDLNRAYAPARQASR